MGMWWLNDGDVVVAQYRDVDCSRGSVRGCGGSVRGCGGSVVKSTG
jgi:hypothetical protein